jgi:hypothetical protein
MPKQPLSRLVIDVASISAQSLPEQSPAFQVID